jgi:hypothetical protein
VYTTTPRLALALGPANLCLPCGWYHRPLCLARLSILLRSGHIKISACGDLGETRTVFLTLPCRSMGKAPQPCTLISPVTCGFPVLLPVTELEGRDRLAINSLQIGLHPPWPSLRPETLFCPYFETITKATDRVIYK